MKIAANVQESQARVAHLLRHTTPEVARVLERAMAGHELSRDEGLVLATLPSDDVETLAAVADHLRREIAGDVITYVVNRNINFTNVCFIGCAFCSFSTSARASTPTTCRSRKSRSAPSKRVKWAPPSVRARRPAAWPGPVVLPATSCAPSSRRCRTCTPTPSRRWK